MQDPLAVVFFAGLLHAYIFASAVAISREDKQGNLFAERGCCRRQSHFLHVGHDVSGSPVSMDVGKCWSSCLSQWVSFPHPSLQGLSRHSSMLDFLRSKKLQLRHPASPLRPEDRRACPLGSCCEPAHLHVERLLLLEGVWEVEVVDGCHCSTCPEECLRLPALKTFFPDSPWEVTVDVGKCSDPTYSAGHELLLEEPVSPLQLLSPSLGRLGPTMEVVSPGFKVTQQQRCRLSVSMQRSPSPALLSVFLNRLDGLFCVPTKFSTALVKNPQGVEVVQTLENCEMKGECYRVSQVESYYETVHSSAGRREERLKEIDVGRCLGSCSSGDPCLLRESQGGEKCLVWAEAVSSRCAPDQYDVHTFRSRRDRVRTVVAIRQCKCRG